MLIEACLLLLLQKRDDGSWRWEQRECSVSVFGQHRHPICKSSSRKLACLGPVEVRLLGRACYLVEHSPAWGAISTICAPDGPKAALSCKPGACGNWQFAGYSIRFVISAESVTATGCIFALHDWHQQTLLKEAGGGKRQHVSSAPHSSYNVWMPPI
jgi:hypothetical protein